MLANSARPHSIRMYVYISGLVTGRRWWAGPGCGTGPSRPIHVSYDGPRPGPVRHLRGPVRGFDGPTHEPAHVLSRTTAVKGSHICAHVFFLLLCRFFVFLLDSVGQLIPAHEVPINTHYPHNSAQPTARSDGFRPDYQ